MPNIIQIFQRYVPNAQTQREINLELEKRNIEIKNSNHCLSCYHPNLTREEAEKKLKENVNVVDGCFLLRACSASPDDFSLSLINDGVCHHYRINSAFDTYYYMSDSPVVQGLDELIRKYQAKAHGLPCLLSKQFISGEMIPAKARISGQSNLLHETVANIAEIGKLKLILKSPHCPDIDEKNEEGCTALDIACMCDNVDAIKELMKKKPNTNLKAHDGFTPLHRAVENNAVCALSYLISSTDANPTERIANDNIVPMHIAAKCNNFLCVRVLLKHGVPDMPRTVDNKTPLDLALEYNSAETVKELRNYEPKQAKTKQHEWLFESNVTREVAQKILIDAKNEHGPGVFLVRRSTKSDNLFVLSLLSNEFFNYEICIKENEKLYYIDDGPYFRSLEHLIEHHFKYEDGLPTRLLHPISANSAVSKNILNNIQTIQHQQSIIINGSSKTIAPTETIRSNRKTSHLLRNEQFLTEFNKKKIKNETKGSKLQDIAPNDLKLESIIGEGEFGTVYKGKYKVYREVAVKTLKDGSATKEFLREAEIMGTLGNHPCIIKLFGLVRQKECIMMVLELMVCSLLDKLYETPRVINENHLKNWAIQIVSGMKHMESKGIVHRDLAARNVLLGSDLQAKISDFGLSRDTEGKDVYTQTSDSKIPIKWYAPESIELCKFTSKSDVWSFGITLWEMWTFGDVPYGEKTGNEVYQFLKQGRRLDRPPECPFRTYDIMKSCWNMNEEQRPNFEKISSLFSKDSDYEVTKSIYFDSGQF